MNDDTIKREDALNALLRMDGTKIDKALAMGEIRHIPSADRPQKIIAQITFDEEKLREIVKEAIERFKEEYEITDRPQGEWRKTTPWSYGGGMGEVYGYYQKCSNCGKEFMDKSNFCPNCGAHMKGATDGDRVTNTTVEDKPTPIRDYMVHGEMKGADDE